MPAALDVLYRCCSLGHAESRLLLILSTHAQCMCECVQRCVETQSHRAYTRCEHSFREPPFPLFCLPIAGRNSSLRTLTVKEAVAAESRSRHEGGPVLIGKRLCIPLAYSFLCTFTIPVCFLFLLPVQQTPAVKLPSFLPGTALSFVRAPLSFWTLLAFFRGCTKLASTVALILYVYPSL